MTDEELKTLIKETSEQIDQLPDDPEKPLTKEEKNRKLMLRLERETLERIKEAKKKRSLHQEMKASVDYALLKQYGEKHPFLLNFFRSQTGWLGW